MRVCIYLLVISFGSHIYFSHLCPLLCNCLYQRLNVSVMCVLSWGLLVHYSSSAVDQICAIGKPYLFSDMSNVCTVLIATWLIALTSYVACICVYIFHISLSGI